MSCLALMTKKKIHLVKGTEEGEAKISLMFKQMSAKTENIMDLGLVQYITIKRKNAH